MNSMRLFVMAVPSTSPAGAPPWEDTGITSDKVEARESGKQHSAHMPVGQDVAQAM